MIILSSWKIEIGIYFNFGKEFTIAITWFLPQKLEKMNWMEQNNEGSSLKFHSENTLCVSNNFATWMEVNNCLKKC